MTRKFWRNCKICGRSRRIADLALVYGEGRKTWWWVCLDKSDCESHR
ncbi:MAG TPA: hypothetical protein VGK41_00195 [Solirubrobacterales bacterium]